MIQPYETYKDSGVEWIGEIPIGWGLVPLKYSLPFQVGFTPSTKVQEYYQNGTNDWVTIGDMDEKHISKSKIKITDKAIQDAQKEITPKGSLLYSFKLSVGKVAFASKDIYTNEAIFSILPNANINLDYYYYSLPEILIHNANHNIYGAPIFNQDIIKNSKLTLPSPEEQTQIARYLDHKTGLIDNIIAQKEQLIDKLKEQRQAIINEAVTKGLKPDAPLKDSGIKWLGKIPEHWEVNRLFALCELVRGNSNFKKDELLSCGEYVALQYGKTYKVEEVNEEFDYYVNEEFHKDSQVVKYGDTIIISTSETIEDLGHSAFYNRNDEGLLGGEQLLIRTKENRMVPEYLFYSSKVFLKEMRRYATGVKVFRFNINDLKNTITTLPPISEQKQIVDYIKSKNDNIKRAIIKTKGSIQKLKEYRQSIISEAVTGKVDVRDWKKNKM